MVGCVTCSVRDLGICRELVPHEGNSERALSPHSQRGAAARELIYLQNQPTNDFIILCYGVAVQFNRSMDGRRKIHSFLQKGDPISAILLFQDSLQFSVEALIDCRFSLFNREKVQRLVGLNPLAHSAIMNACISNQRDIRNESFALALGTARERVVDLILRFTDRMTARYMIKDGIYPFPLRQQDISDSTGLSLAHVNRVIADLRKAELIELSHSTLRILDLESLKEIVRKIAV